MFDRMILCLQRIYAHEGDHSHEENSLGMKIAALAIPIVLIIILLILKLR